MSIYKFCILIYLMYIQPLDIGSTNNIGGGGHIGEKEIAVE